MCESTTCRQFQRVSSSRRRTGAVVLGPAAFLGTGDAQEGTAAHSVVEARPMDEPRRGDTRGAARQAPDEQMALALCLDGRPTFVTKPRWKLVLRQSGRGNVCVECLKPLTIIYS